MISLKRMITVAAVSAGVLLSGAAVASACPGDAELPAGSVAAAMPDGSGSAGSGEQEAEAPLSATCTAALSVAAQDRSARFSSVAAQVASACAQDSATVGTVLDYAAGQL